MKKPDSRPAAQKHGEKGLPARDKVLDAAERLLRADPGATFSMRDLATEAGVSFATPFNQYGSKAAIAQALSVRRITEMAGRLQTAKPEGDAIERTLAAFRIAADLLVEEPAVNRAMMGALGTWTGKPSTVAAHSASLWSSSLGVCDGLDPGLVALAGGLLPGQLALGFRGCLSFWVAGEIGDAALPPIAESAAAVILACFAPAARREVLLIQATNQGGAWLAALQGA